MVSSKWSVVVMYGAGGLLLVGKGRIRESGQSIVFLDRTMTRCHRRYYPELPYYFPQSCLWSGLLSSVVGVVVGEGVEESCQSCLCHCCVEGIGGGGVCAASQVH